MTFGHRVLGFVVIALAAAGGIGCAPAQSSSTEHSARATNADGVAEVELVEGDGSEWDDVDAQPRTKLEICNWAAMNVYHDFRDQDGNWLGGGWDLQLGDCETAKILGQDTTIVGYWVGRGVMDDSYGTMHVFPGLHAKCWADGDVFSPQYKCQEAD